MKNLLSRFRSTHKEHQPHRGEPVSVGEYTVHLGGTMHLEESDLDFMDVLIPLTGSLPRTAFGRQYNILAAALQDYGGVPEGWEEFLRDQVVPLLAEGKQVLAYCVGSHGRTGCFLASLIAILEPEIEDPIEEARKRHCEEAVESLAQAEAIFAIKGMDVPWAHYEAFRREELYSYLGHRLKLHSHFGVEKEDMYDMSLNDLEHLAVRVKAVEEKIAAEKAAAREKKKEAEAISG